MSLIETSSNASSLSTASYVSDEETTTINDLPRFPKSASSSRLLEPPAPQCTRNHSFTSLTPHTRLEERQIISSYVASNLRRSKSSTSYQKTKLSLYEQNENSRNRERTRSSISSHNNNLKSSSKNHAHDRENIKENKGLCRKSSFSYVPSFEQISTNGSAARDFDVNLLSKGNANQKKRNSRTHESHRKNSTKEFDLNARLREPSITATTRINLRDSAIDLVSDEEHSEAYTAVSLAGTLRGKHSIKPIQTFRNIRHQNKKFYVIIGVLCVIIIVLGGLAVALALVLFR